VVFPGKEIIVKHGKLRALSLLLAWLVKRFIKVGARASYHSRRRYAHVASAFPLAHHYHELLVWGH
jgi:hypothetical protein